MTKRLSIILPVLALFFIGCSVQAERPNILLILVDDMSYNGIRSYGNQPWKTPHIDSLAEGGMKWTDAYAYPVCSPTRSALLTGKNTVRTGITNWIPGWAEKSVNPPLLERPFQHHLALSEWTIAEALGSYGYETALVGKWHVGENILHRPNKQGFDHQYMMTVSNTGLFFVDKEEENLSAFSRKESENSQFLTEHLVDKANAWLEDRDNEPWFLYFSTHVVHTPIVAMDEKVQKYINQGLPATGPDSAVYAAMHEHMDEAIGRLLKKIDDLGYTDNTIIVFLSDNGGRIPQTTNDPLRGSKGELLEGGIRVPLIVQWPDKIQAGSSTSQIAVVDDLFPTLLDLANCPPVDPQTIDGISLAPVLLDQKDSLNRDTLYFHYPHYNGKNYGVPSSALRSGKWKLIHRYEADGPELYDLSRDIGETNNLFSKETKVAHQLMAQLETWRKENQLLPPEPNPDYDPSQPSEWAGEVRKKM